MVRVKTALNRACRMLSILEQREAEGLRGRITRLGYDPEEVMGAFSLELPPARERLLVFLEYEEAEREGGMGDVTEFEYACQRYPEVVLNYLEYLLDGVAVPPAEEIPELKRLVLDRHPHLAARYEQLERKWLACINKA